MFGKKCARCNNKIKKDFVYCPYCSLPLKKRKEEDFGMLGEGDEIDLENQIIGGGMLDKMIGSMVKQLTKDLAKAEGLSGGIPSGFKIQISTGNPQMEKLKQEREKKRKEVVEYVEKASDEEIERRKSLPKENAVSLVRRLSDKIIYEISTPNVKSKRDIVITKFENSIEVKAYSRDKCYIKSIPLKVEILGFYLEDEKLFLELKS